MLYDLHFHPLVVAEVIDETADTRSFVLDIPAELEDTFEYAAGQFCSFRTTIDGEPIVRAYSMSSAPGIGEPFKTTVKRVPNGRMSNWMNDTLRVGDAIEVMKPAGLFVLRESENTPTPDVPIVAFGGGSGITPIISIIKRALAETTRDIRLVYANRDANAVIFADELTRLRASAGGRLSIHHHLDSERGFLEASDCAALVGDRSHGDFYVCGPAPYMDTVEAGLALLGVAPEQRYIERFVVPSNTLAVAASVTETVVIRLDRKKHTLDYRAGDTVLETARRAGLRAPFSCESGSCATCMAHVDAGEVTMRVNNALSADEVAGGWALTCQAMPTSREVVINYDA